MKKDLLNRLARRLGRWNLRRQAMLVYVLCVLLPVAILTFFVYDWVTGAARVLLRSSMETVLARLRDNAEERIERYRRVAIQIAVDGNLAGVVQRAERGVWDRLEADRYMNRLISPIYTLHPAIRNIRIFSDQRLRRSYGTYVFSAESLAGQPWYEYVRAHADRIFYWFGRIDPITGRQLLMLVAVLRDNQTGAGQWGLLKMDIDAALAFGSLTEVGQGQLGWILLVDRTGAILAGEGRRSFGTILDQPYAEQVFSGQDGRLRAVLPEGATEVYYATVAGIKVIYGVPLSALTSRVNRFGLVAVGAVGFAALLAGTVLFSAAGSIRRRLLLLSNKAHQVEQGDFDITLDQIHWDEIGHLDRVFHGMAQRLQRLLDEVTETHRRMREEELKALQAQINPHFLYNTLALIRWLVEMNGAAGTICELVDDMSTFYRLVLNRGKEIVSLRDELALTEAYIRIQQARFKDEFQVEVDVDPTLKDCAIIKLILQPLVENAIAHGISGLERPGRIVIRGVRDGGDIRLTVEDDGRGMDEETLHSLLSPGRQPTGYGLYNVHERIRLFFGPTYGLTIRSAHGEGTSVEIRIPVWRRDSGGRSDPGPSLAHSESGV